MKKALKIDEILRLIIYSVDSPATAYRCARVSRAWSEHALSLLWRGSLRNDTWETPTIAEIRSCDIPPNRLRIYMSYARFVDLREGDYPENIEFDAQTTTQLLDAGDLFAPHATFLSVNLTDECMNGTTICPLLVPTLRSLKLFGGHFSNDFLITLKSHCPLLQSLLLDNQSKLMTPDRFTDFLGCMSQLRALNLLENKMPVSEDLALQLLSRDNLEHLRLFGMDGLSLDLLNKLTNSGSPTAASSLRKLTLDEVDGLALQRLLPMLTNLQSFFLGSYSRWARPSGDILAPLAHCSRLREVSFFISNETPLSIDRLIALMQSCQKLVRLAIYRRSESMPISMSLPQGMWEQFLKHMINIEILILEVEISISMAQFALLATACPRLLSLHLYVGLHMSEIRAAAKPGAFMMLEELSVLSAMSFESFETPVAMQGAAQWTASILQEYMPRLGAFWSTQIGVIVESDQLGHNLIDRLISSRTNLQRTIRTESIQGQLERELVLRTGVSDIHGSDFE